MALEFSIQQVEAQPMAGIRVDTTMDKLSEIMGPLYGEIMGALQPKGAAPSGMPFARYHGMGGNDVDVECGIPLTEPVESEGRVTAGELPAGKTATVTHVGPYDQLPTSWSALMDWVQAEGLKPNGAPWEVYATDPTQESDPAKWRTNIFMPVE